MLSLNPDIERINKTSRQRIRKRPDGREELVSMTEIMCSVANNPSISTVLISMTILGTCGKYHAFRFK